MAELLIRASSQDRSVLRDIYGLDGRPPALVVPDRIVVDAHTASKSPDLMTTIRECGTPLLVDPQTFNIQGTQHATDSWASLPFGQPDAWTIRDASTPGVLDRFIAQVVEHQLATGATWIIPPYVHIDVPSSEWVAVQIGLYRLTRRYLDHHRINLPVTAILALGWRFLHPIRGAEPFAALTDALSDLAPTELALAASRVDAGIRPQDRAIDLIVTVERLGVRFPVVLWQQGRLGELGIAAGAVGYECGIGWRERCDLPKTWNRRVPKNGGGQSRPVYIPALGCSIPKRTLVELQTDRNLWMRLLCTEPDCCPPAGQGLLGDARAHAIVQRGRRLKHLSQIDRSVWRWQQLADHATTGLDLARSINQYASTRATVTHFDEHALTAVLAVSKSRRLDSKARRVA